MKYYKPKKDLEYSCLLRPQKHNGKKQWRCQDFSYKKRWVENGDIAFNLLKKNFIEVPNEAEAIEGY